MKNAIEQKLSYIKPQMTVLEFEQKITLLDASDQEGCDCDDADENTIGVKFLD